MAIEITIDPTWRRIQNPEMPSPIENVNEAKPTGIQIWIDADACPQVIKAILFRTSQRRKIKTVLVANSSLRIPKNEFVDVITVPHGADSADKKILELMQLGDIVITADIPLAAEVVKKQGTAIGTRGELLDESSVLGRLASRNLSEQLRSAGIETGGPKPHNQKDTQAFANQLDRMLTKLIGK